MALFSKTPPNRAKLLERARKARSKKKKKKAISLYRQALELDGRDVEVHARLAPLLGETGDLEGAWKSFCIAADGYRDKGFLDKSVGMYRQAVQYIPKHAPAWEQLAQADIDRDRPLDARDTLLKGAKVFMRRPNWNRAVHMLRKAFDLHPWHYEVTYALALSLAKDGDKEQAKRLLEELAGRVRKRRLRQVRGLLFRMSPNPATFWRWLRAALAGK